MPDEHGPLTLPDVVTLLRAAGCVFAEDEADLLLAAAPTPAELADMVDRRVQGLPLEQILGWAEFCGLRILVDPGVFVPRRRTELLARQAIALAPDAGARGGAPIVVVDLCCGSGAVGAALLAALDGVEVHAADIDPVAVQCARRNVVGPRGHVYEGDLDAPLPAELQGRIDILVANAPYVPIEEIRLMPPEARLHEPQRALDGGVDGLDLHRRVAQVAPRWLAPSGHVLIETSERQAQQTAQLLADVGLVAWVVTDDELDGTVVVAAWPTGVVPPEPAPHHGAP
jgi:release factor glutamine methyltransferase